MPGNGNGIQIITNNANKITTSCQLLSKYDNFTDDLSCSAGHNSFGRKKQLNSKTCQNIDAIIALRSAMGHDRLTALALLTVHKDIPVNTDNVVSRFAEKAPRIKL